MCPQLPDGDGTKCKVVSNEPNLPNPEIVKNTVLDTCSASLKERRTVKPLSLLRDYFDFEMSFVRYDPLHQTMLWIPTRDSLTITRHAKIEIALIALIAVIITAHVWRTPFIAVDCCRGRTGGSLQDIYVVRREWFVICSLWKPFS